MIEDLQGAPWAVRIWPDPATRTRARELRADEFTSGIVRSVAGNLLATMRQHRGVGIAAPQIGVMVRLAIVAAPGLDPIVLANPRVVDAPPVEEWAQGGEGCLSIPHVGMPVRRPAWVELEAQDLDGRTVELDAAGYEAAIVMHELDHLAGLTIADVTLPEARRRLRALLLEHETRVTIDRKVFGAKSHRPELLVAS